MKQIVPLLLLVFCSQFSYAQQPDFIRGATDRIRNMGGATSGGKDTIGFVHRDDRKDSISITYKYIDSVRSIPMDSTINDFDKYFSLPSGYQSMGNNGSAAYPFVYKPFAKPGWDAGFHAFDVYRF